MAGNGGGKRLKTADEGDDVHAELRQRNASPVRAEIVQLRRRARLPGGNDEGHPVVVAATVDLSRIDSGIVAEIFSFLGQSRELFNLAMTCKSS